MRVGNERLTGALVKPVKEILGFQLLPWHHCHLLAAEAICIIYRHQKPNRLRLPYMGFHKKHEGQKKTQSKNEDWNRKNWKENLSLHKSRWRGLRCTHDNSMCVEGIASLCTNVDYIHIYIKLSQFTYYSRQFKQAFLLRRGWWSCSLCCSGPRPLSWLAGGLCTGLHSVVYEWVKLDVRSRGGTVSAFFIVIS